MKWNKQLMSHKQFCNSFLSEANIAQFCLSNCEVLKLIIFSCTINLPWQVLDPSRFKYNLQSVHYFWDYFSSFFFLSSWSHTFLPEGAFWSDRYSRHKDTNLFPISKIIIFFRKKTILMHKYHNMKIYSHMGMGNLIWLQKLIFWLFSKVKMSRGHFF